MCYTLATKKFYTLVEIMYSFDLKKAIINDSVFDMNCFLQENLEVFRSMNTTTQKGR